MEDNVCRSEQEMLIHFLKNDNGNDKWELKDIKKILPWDKKRIKDTVEKCMDDGMIEIDEEEDGAVPNVEGTAERSYERRPFNEKEKTFYCLSATAQASETTYDFQSDQRRTDKVKSAEHSRSSSNDKNDLYKSNSDQNLYTRVIKENNESNDNTYGNTEPLVQKESITENFVHLVTDYQMDILKALEEIKQEMIKQKQEDFTKQEMIDLLNEKVYKLEMKQKKSKQNLNVARDEDYPTKTKSNGFGSSEPLDRKSSYKDKSDSNQTSDDEAKYSNAKSKSVSKSSQNLTSTEKNEKQPADPKKSKRYTKMSKDTNPKNTKTKDTKPPLGLWR